MQNFITFLAAWRHTTFARRLIIFFFAGLYCCACGNDLNFADIFEESQLNLWTVEGGASSEETICTKVSIYPLKIYSLRYKGISNNTFTTVKIKKWL